jgi:molecular chaperone DnaK (HSP70)
VVATYPVRWGARRQAALAEAVTEAGLASPELVPEPEAAARHFGAHLREGQTVAVYDLGGGTFDTAVLRKTAEGFDQVGSPGGIDNLGGEDFDYLVYQSVGRQLPENVWESLQHDPSRAWREANTRLRYEDAKRIKEDLSSTSSQGTYVAMADRDVQLTQDELEGLLREQVTATVDELERTLRDANLDHKDLAGLYLVGGSSRIPLVQRLIRGRFGQDAKTMDHPKLVVCLGAAVNHTNGQKVEQAAPVPTEPTKPVLDPAGAWGQTPPEPTSPQPTSPQTAPPAQARPTKSRRKRWAIAGSAAAAVIVAVVVVLVLVMSGGGGGGGGGGSEITPCGVSNGHVVNCISH